MKTHPACVVVLALCVEVATSVATDMVALRQDAPFPPPELQTVEVPQSPLLRRVFSAFTLYTLANNTKLVPDVPCVLGWMDAPGSGPDAGVLTKVPATSEVVFLTNRLWAIVFDPDSTTTWFAEIDWKTNVLRSISQPWPARRAIDEMKVYLHLAARDGMPKAPVDQLADVAAVVMEPVRRPVSAIACILCLVILLALRWRRDPARMKTAFAWLGALILAATCAVILFLAGVQWQTRKSVCGRNLAEINQGKTLTAQVKQLSKGQAVSEYEVTCFLPTYSYCIPACPSGGEYVIDVVGVPPHCTWHGTVMKSVSGQTGR
jgi:hypothetical protein